jgi:hypothetical protein
MLQIITGMYFKTAPCYETRHRRVLYTNAKFTDAELVDLPIGSLASSTKEATINAVTVQFTERLEVADEDGKDLFLISTGGDEIVEDIATVLSFAFDAVFTPIREKADRLIRPASGRMTDPTPADVLPRTFNLNRRIIGSEIQDAQKFIDKLLSLNRLVFERALKAMRRVVVASERAAEDPTLSYTDYVAALESLSAEFEASVVDWDRLDPRRRKILDPALKMLATTDAEKVRSAILEAERAGIKSRYTDFVISHVRPSFFRDDAIGSQRAIWGPKLRRALAEAYSIRSGNVHEIRLLDVEAWYGIDGAETFSSTDGRFILTQAGLNRLTRHVVRTYVQNGSVELDSDYDWRRDLPGLYRGQLAPEVYLGYVNALSRRNAGQRASEFIGLVIEAVAHGSEFKVDMRPVLTRIENLLQAEGAPSVRLPLLAMYYLWHRVMNSTVHQPAPEALMAVAVRELETPNVYSFAIAILLGVDTSWSVDDVCELAEDRYSELQKRRFLELPPRLDASLWLYAAHRLSSVNMDVVAHAAVARAVECWPGSKELINFERVFETDRDATFDIRGFVLGVTGDAGSNS